MQSRRMSKAPLLLIMMIAVFPLFACTTSPSHNGVTGHQFKDNAANACQPEAVFQTGKKGEFFNRDLCEATTNLQKKHAAGVWAYCQRENGFAAGAIGKAYNGICPASLSKAFVFEFNRGRLSYMNAMIATNESELGDIESTIGRLEDERYTVESQQNEVPPEFDSVIFNQRTRAERLRALNRDLRVEMTLL